MKTISRRDVIKTVGAAAGVSLFGLPAFSLANGADGTQKQKLKIIVVGAHPDDPESICGGTMALFANAGHEVVSAYLTLGEAGIDGKSHEEAAKIRTAELREACQILKARPEFLGQIDGSTEINAAQYAKMQDFLKKENPDLVFTHWPIDTHRDHRVCSSLVLDAWYHLQRKFDLYYAEAMTGAQSQNFNPTDYVDITTVVEQKHNACFVHRSQKMEEEYPLYHGQMELFRGMEYNCKYAEAFVRHFQKPKRTIL
jgi:LmbE family N-acetylglucosaminyl deacetylase